MTGSAWSLKASGVMGHRGESVFLRVQNRVTWSGACGERGATAVEYGLIIVFIAAVVAVALPVMGNHISQAFVNVIKGF